MTSPNDELYPPQQAARAGDPERLALDCVSLPRAAFRGG